MLSNKSKEWIPFICLFQTFLWTKVIEKTTIALLCPDPCPNPWPTTTVSTWRIWTSLLPRYNWPMLWIGLGFHKSPWMISMWWGRAILINVAYAVRLWLYILQKVWSCQFSFFMVEFYQVVQIELYMLRRPFLEFLKNPGQQLVKALGLQVVGLLALILGPLQRMLLLRVGCRWKMKRKKRRKALILGPLELMQLLRIGWRWKGKRKKRRNNFTMKWKPLPPALLRWMKHHGREG